MLLAVWESRSLSAGQVEFVRVSVWRPLRFCPALYRSRVGAIRGDVNEPVMLEEGRAASFFEGP